MSLGRTVVGAQARGRWALVLAFVVLLCCVPVVLNLRPARAAEIAPAALLAKIAASRDQPFEGYAQASGLLPLPSLRNLEQVTALVSGLTEMRTWYAAKNNWRVDVINGGSERDLYQTPDAQYVWDYGDNQLSRITGDQPVRLPRAADLVPTALVHTLIDLAAGETLSSIASRKVAGIDAAGIRITPAATGTTVQRIDLWADPATGLPLQAEVTARGGQRPVFTTRFLDLKYGTPKATVLTPPAPTGAIGYTETAAPDLLSAINRRRYGLLPDRLGELTRRDAVARISAVGVYGTGLDQLIVVSLPGRFGAQAYDQIATYGTKVTVPDGTSAAMIATGLLSVLVVRGQRTYLVAGLVGPAVLQATATDLAGAAS